MQRSTELSRRLIMQADSLPPPPPRGSNQGGWLGCQGATVFTTELQPGNIGLVALKERQWASRAHHSPTALAI